MTRVRKEEGMTQKKQKNMKATVLHAPGDLRCEEVPVPEIGATDVLLKIKATGNCGSDLQRIMVEGTHRLPCIPGHEFAGEVAALGRDVSSWKPGDRATAAPQIPCYACEWCQLGEFNLCNDYDYVGSRSDGSFAQYVKIPAVNLVRMPETVDFEEAAATDPACIALHGIRRAGGIRTGETLVVLGAGPIGLFACQWGRILGAGQVIAVDIVEEKLKVAAQLGADVTINGNEEDVVGAIKKLTGDGAGLVMETAGTLATQRQSLQVARKRGRVVSIGRSHKDVLLPDAIYSLIFRRELEVYGSVNTSFAGLNNEWRTALSFMARRALKVKPLISHRITLARTPEMFARMHRKEVVYSKIIILPWEGETQ